MIERPEGFRRVASRLAALGHREAPLWLDVAARTSQEAADALGVAYKTVANNCSQMKAKLGVERTADLIRLALTSLKA